MISNVFLRRVCWLIPAVFCCVAAVFFGKDINFDAFNYHGYTAFALLHGRLATDFFAAGPQSYHNPVSYIPFYVLTLFCSDIFVSIGLALLQSGCIYGVIFLTRELVCIKENKIVYFLTIVLSLLTVTFWQVVGSTFIDGDICALVLFGVVYFLRWGKDFKSLSGNKNASIAAFLFGLACGLKLTAVIYAVAAGITAFVFFALYAKQWKQFMLFVLFGIAGFMVVEGWWAYCVYIRTGNPFFPYFNHIFRAPLYFDAAITNTRFIPESIMDFIQFPLRAVMPAPWLYQELRAPDIRFLVAFSLMAGGMFFLKNKIRASFVGLSAVSFFVIAYVLWAITSGNGRYGIPLFLMVGVLIAWFLLQLFKEALVKNILLLLVVFQFILVFTGGEFRWTRQDFASNWFDYNVPENLTKKPALYLTLSNDSNSFLASKVHSSSAFANLSGQLSLPLSEGLQSYLKEAEDRVDGHVRFIDTVVLERKGVITDKDLPRIDNAQLSSRLIYVMNSQFSRFGYRVDKTDCVFILQNVNIDDINSHPLFSCGLKKDPKAIESFKEQVGQIDVVFNAVEAKCVKFFNPRTSLTEKYGDLWQRNYVGSDVSIYLSAGTVWVKFINTINVLNVGTFVGILNNVENINCSNGTTPVSKDFL